MSGNGRRLPPLPPSADRLPGRGVSEGPPTPLFLHRDVSARGLYGLSSSDQEGHRAQAAQLLSAEGSGSSEERPHYRESSSSPTVSHNAWSASSIPTSSSYPSFASGRADVDHRRGVVAWSAPTLPSLVAPASPSRIISPGGRTLPPIDHWARDATRDDWRPSPPGMGLSISQRIGSASVPLLPQADYPSQHPSSSGPILSPAMPRRPEWDGRRSLSAVNERGERKGYAGEQQSGLALSARHHPYATGDWDASGPAAGAYYHGLSVSPSNHRDEFAAGGRPHSLSVSTTASGNTSLSGTSHRTSTSSAAAAAAAAAAAPHGIGSHLQALPTGIVSASGHTSGPPRQRRAPKTHVPSACVNCKKTHLACDVERPCGRCVLTGKADTCVDARHKKRGRPRLRDRVAGTPKTRDSSTTRDSSADTSSRPPVDRPSPDAHVAADRAGFR